MHGDHRAWDECELGEGIELISGQHILAQSYSSDPNGIPYLTGPVDFPDGNILISKYTAKPKRLCDTGDILITVKGSGTGKMVRADRPYCISRQLMAIRVIAWHSDYVFYWLQHVGRTFEQVASGLIPGISREDILGLLILLPPLLEQRKIAEILGTWDAAIERVTRLIAALQRRKQGLMQRLLTGKVRFPEFVRSEAKQQTRYTSLPAEWNYVAISEIAREVSLRNTNGDALSVLSCTKYAGLVDSLSYFGRQIFSEDTSDYKVVKRAQFAYATNHIEEGSIGYQDLCDVALISPMYTVFETTGGVDDAFLYRLLKTELYRHIFEVNTSGTVNRRGRLGWEDFARIKVPLPSEAEQRKIAEFFATVDQEINLQQQRLAALRQQKQGLMQRLLTGQVRVQV